MLERVVLNTNDVKKTVEELKVVTLIADWTKRDEVIGKVLEKLGSRQLPLLAIFPAKTPTKPIVLLGMYSKAKLIDRLKTAGPSQAAVPSSEPENAVTPVANSTLTK